MSALTDLFTALANKIRSKTGTATTYTPLEMVSDGIDDVYDAGYAAGGGGATGIPITPSNASPVSLTTGESYEMLADGYAISSYTNVTPSNSNPVSLSNNTIYKTGGAGVAIASYSSVTPSNASPVTLSSGSIYKMGGAGKAVASVTDATPSNSSPVSLTSGTVYKMGGAGKAVASVTDITPSDSSPVSMSSGSIYKAGSAGYAIASNPTSVTPSASGVYFSSGIKKMASSGYAYSSQQPKTATGSFNLTTSANMTITLGFKPKYICVYGGSTANPICVYSEDVSTSKYYSGSSSAYVTNYNLPSTTTNRINSITSDGFIMNKASSAGVGTYRYFAIG